MSKPLLPKAGSHLIDAGMPLPNAVGPFAGGAPDIGAYEVGLGVPWVGPRRYSKDRRLAFGLPDGWRVESLEQVKEFCSLGASAPPAEAKVLLIRDARRAFIVIELQPMPPEQAWAELARFAPEDGQCVYYLRDGLAVCIRPKPTAGSAALEGFRVQPDGLLRVTAGAEEAGLEPIRDDFLTVMRSLYY